MKILRRACLLDERSGAQLRRVVRTIAQIMCGQTFFNRVDQLGNTDRLAERPVPLDAEAVFVSGFVTSAVRKITGVLCNSGSASICAATSPPSVSGIIMSSKITSGLKFWAL